MQVKVVASRRRIARWMLPKAEEALAGRLRSAAGRSDRIQPAKDIAGPPLLRGVSFKLERRERLTIAGRNGAGKTTLLRMLAGEEAIDGGELSIAKGVRVVLHDQRPPRERGVALRDYLLSGCANELEIEAALGELERRWPRARPTRRRSIATRAPRRGSSTTAATCGATARRRWRRASASTTRDLERGSTASPAAS